MLKELNNENFAEETKNGVKLIEFRTEWCGYCKKQQPELEAMNKVWIGQVDADNASLISAKYNINSFPTFLIMKNGEEVERFSGMRKKEELMSKIMKHLD
jgi:thioredoxin 1